MHISVDYKKTMFEKRMIKLWFKIKKQTNKQQQLSTSQQTVDGVGSYRKTDQF